MTECRGLQVLCRDWRTARRANYGSPRIPFVLDMVCCSSASALQLIDLAIMFEIGLLSCTIA